MVVIGVGIFGGAAGGAGSIADFTVFLLLAFVVVLCTAIFRDKLLGRSPQARLDARLGVRHSCGGGREGLWQYVGPWESLENLGGVVWRRFRVCPTCGECQYWPLTVSEPGASGNWRRWRPILFDDMLTRVKIREESVAKLSKELDEKRRVLEEKRARIEREAAEAEAKQRESNEKAREFVNAKIHLFNEKPDPSET